MLFFVNFILFNEIQDLSLKPSLLLLFIAALQAFLVYHLEFKMPKIHSLVAGKKQIKLSFITTCSAVFKLFNYPQGIYIYIYI